MGYSRDFSQERVQELTEEMNTAKEQTEVILKFIELTEQIPTIVLETLEQKLRKLKVTIEDCKLRMKNYD